MSTAVATHSARSVTSEKTGDSMAYMSLDMINADPQLNSRTVGYQDDTLTPLAESIKDQGTLIQPLVVFRSPPHQFEKHGKLYTLLAGYRRFFSLHKLARETGDEAWLHDVPVVVKASPDQIKLAAAQLIENIQRQDMNALDISNEIASLMKSNKMNGTQIAVVLGLPPKEVAQYLKMLKLPDPVQAMIQEGALAFGLACELVKLPEDQWQKGAEIAIGMTLDEFTQYVAEMLEETEDTATAGNAAAAGGAQRDSRTTAAIKPKTLETVFLPKLEQDLQTAKTEAQKAELQIRIDTCKWLLNGQKGTETHMSKYLAPYIEECEAKEAAEEAASKAEKLRKEYVHACVKGIREKLKPTNYKSGETIPTLPQALASVLVTVKTDLEGKKITGFELPDSLDDFSIELTQAFEADEKGRKDATAKRAAAKAEREKKEAEEKAAKDAAGEASTEAEE